MNLSALSDQDLVALRSGELSKVSEAGLLALKGNEPSDTAVAINAVNKGIAGIPDALLNAPTNVINLFKAGIGTVAGAAGRPDLQPEVTAPPSYGHKAMKGMGFIRDAAEPVNTRQRIIDAMMQGGPNMLIAPAKTGGELLANFVKGMMGGGAGGATKEATGSEPLAISAAMLAPSAVNAAANSGHRKVEQSAAKEVANEVRDKTLADSRAEGYVVPPSVVNPSFLNNRLSSIGGKAALAQEADLRNQDVTNRIAGEETGVPGALTTGKLEQRRDVLAEPYREVASLSPIAANALDKLKEVRADAKAWHRHYDMQGHPDSLKKAQQLDQQADMIEGVIDRIATKSNQPDLVDELRQARQEIAKTHDVERSLNLGDAGVSAPTIGRMYDQGKPLSGGLETIGRFQQAFKPYAREGASVPAPGVSGVEPFAMSGLGMAGAAASGSPAGLIAGGLPLLRGPVRSLLLSKPYQEMFATPNYSPGMIARVLDNLPRNTSPEVAIQAILTARAIAERKQGAQE